MLQTDFYIFGCTFGKCQIDKEFDLFIRSPIPSSKDLRPSLPIDYANHSYSMENLQCLDKDRRKIIFPFAYDK